MSTKVGKRRGGGSLAPSQQTGTTETSQVLLKAHAHSYFRDGSGYSALLHAAMRGHEAVVAEMLHFGPDLDQMDNAGARAFEGRG